MLLERAVRDPAIEQPATMRVLTMVIAFPYSNVCLLLSLFWRTLVVRSRP